MANLSLYETRTTECHKSDLTWQHSGYGHVCHTLLDPSISGALRPLPALREALSPSAASRAPTSMGSPRGVPVPCTATYPTLGAARLASNSAALHAVVSAKFQLVEGLKPHVPFKSTYGLHNCTQRLTIARDTANNKQEVSSKQRALRARNKFNSMFCCTSLHASHLSPRYDTEWHV